MNTKEYYIDFSGYCKVEATSIEEAEEKFWTDINKPFKELFNEVWDIDAISECV